MKFKYAGFLLIVFCLGLISCSSAPVQNQDQGWVLMNYVTSAEKGISGVEPVDLGEDVIVVQEAFPGTLDELKAEIRKDLISGEMPESRGTYRGSVLTWELYEGEAEIPDIGPFTIHLLMGIAAADETSYFVALVALPDSFAENSARFESVFYHTLYGFSPIE
jgi:hypothetical protein